MVKEDITSTTSEARLTDAPRPRQAWMPRQIDSIVEQRIREAADRGKFDKLSTMGKPVRLDLKDAIDRDAWCVNRTMHSLGAVPAWIEMAKEIDADEERLRSMAHDFARWLDGVRHELRSLPAQQRSAARPKVQLRFDDRYARYREIAERLRDQIERFNFAVPVRTLEKPGVWVAHELTRLSDPYTALLQEMSWDATDESDDNRGRAPAPSAGGTGDQERPARARRLLDIWRRFASAPAPGRDN